MKSHLRNLVASLLAVTLIGTWFARPTRFSAAAPNDRPEQHVGRSAAANEGRSIYAEIAKAPEKARAMRNPFENSASAIAAGGKLFEEHCAECHGEMAEGGKKASRLRDDEVQDAAPGALFWVLTNGVVRRGMPVWSKLPEPQRWQIVSFLKSLRADSSTRPTD